MLLKYLIKIKKTKPLHKAGIEPATPAVLRRCHNQLDHLRVVNEQLAKLFKN